MSGGVPTPPPPQPGEFNEKNGGDTAWGRWEQTQEEVHGYVTVPENTRARELQVEPARPHTRAAPAPAQP